MLKRVAPLPLTLLSALALSLALLSGCAETQPTTASYTGASITMTPRFLPDPPAGMIYELWVQNEDGTSQSLGRFGWDVANYQMTDATGASMPDFTFDANFNILEWDFLSVSIENIDSVSGVSPQSVMLRDTIRHPDEEKFLVMRFPVNFAGDATGIFSLETPTDGNLSNDAFGVWFAVYSSATPAVEDTSGASADPTLTAFLSRSPNDDSLGSTIDTIGIDSVKPVTYNRYSRFNLDTVTINSVRVFYAVVPINRDTVDTIHIFGGPTGDRDTISYPPNSNAVPSIVYDTIPRPNASVHQFQSGFDNLPILTGSYPANGWRFKGWVLGPHLGTGPNEFVRMPFQANKELNWQKENRLLFSTGIFKDTAIDSSVILDIDTVIYGADSMTTRVIRQYTTEIGHNFPGTESQPYADDSRTSFPPFPGEDFLKSGLAAELGVTSTSAPTPPNMFSLAETSVDTGIVFISVEPENYYDSTRNFPLILFARSVDFFKGGFAYKNIDFINQAGISYPFPNTRKSWPHIVIEHKLR